MFHRQTIDRLKNDEAAQNQGDLALRGKKKNQLASMAQAQLDSTSKFGMPGNVADTQQSNKDQFRLKKQRYGW